MWLNGAQEEDSYSRSERKLFLFGLSTVVRNTGSCRQNAPSFVEKGLRREQKLFSSPTLATRCKLAVATAFDKNNSAKADNINHRGSASFK